MGAAGFWRFPSVAEITPDGLIKAKATGSAIVSVIHEGKQHDIKLNVQIPVIGPSQVDSKTGTSVQDADGNILMVPPGALPTGTTVSIQTKNVADLNIPLPGGETQSGLAVVEIDLGGAKAQMPLQLAIKVQGEVDPVTGQTEVLTAGTEVFFWRKGIIRDAQGVEHDTWWLVDNGVIGEDGVARTSSPPYSGVTGTGGVFAITKSKVANPNTGEIEVSGAFVNFDVMWAQAAMMAFAPTAVMSMTAIGMFSPWAVTPIKYTLMGTYSLATPIPAGEFARCTVPE